MKLQVKYIILVFLLVSWVGASSQVNNYYTISQNSNRLQGKLTGYVYNLTSFKNQNYFLHDDWKKGTVYLEDGDSISGIMLRYLAYGDELVTYNDKSRTIYIIDKEIVKGFTIEDENRLEKFVKLYFDGLVKGYKYFDVLYKTSGQLLADHFVSETKTQPYKDIQGVMRDSEYKLDIKYYIYSKDNGFNRLNRNKISFINNFPDHKKEVKKLIRRRELGKFDQQGMVKAIKILDEAGIFN